MRICHIVTMLERGGAQWNTILSAEESIRRGHTVWMIASRGELSAEARARLGSAYLELGEEIETAAIPGWEGPSGPRRFAPMVRPVHPVLDHFAFHDLRGILRALRPDVVHTHSSKAGILGRWAAHRSTDAAIVHTAHGWGFHARQNQFSRNLYALAERVTARITDKIVVVAAADREKALAQGIGRPDQFVTIRSAIAAPSPDDDLSEESLLKTLERSSAESSTRDPIGECEFTVTWIGNAKPQKDPETMARIVSQCALLIPNAVFLIVGGGDELLRCPPVAELRRFAGEKVRFLGWREDVPQILNVTDLLLHTAIHEGLPRVILEAISRGVPVVSTAVDGIPEAVSAEAGVLLDPGNVPGFVEAVCRIAGDPDLRRRMSAAALASFRPEFTLPFMFDRLDELYRSLEPGAQRRQYTQGMADRAGSRG